MDSNFLRNYHQHSSSSSLEQRQYGGGGGGGGENCSVPGPGLGGLSRYRSAPTSCFADVDFLCPPSSPETEQILESFISGSAKSTARAMESRNGEVEIPMTMKREETGEGLAEQRSYASPVSRDMGMEYMVVGGGTEATRVVPAKEGYVPSSLVRHSSLPGGLFDDMNINERPVSRLSGTLSPIHEIGKKNMVEVTTSDSGYLTRFPIGSFAEGRLSPGNLFPDRQRGGNDDMDVFLGDQIDEEEEVHRTLQLARHLSLPRKSSAAIESFLHLQDSVPFKVRAKRGCATHPRSVAERVRRTKISERIRKLQDLVPNMDKQTNTADMLDLAVDYIKELQGQVKTLSDDHARCTCSNMKFL